MKQSSNLSYELACQVCHFFALDLESKLLFDESLSLEHPEIELHFLLLLLL